MNKSNIILIVVIGFVFLALTYGAYVISGGGKSPTQIINYNTSDNSKPQVKVQKFTGDMGKIKVSEKKIYDFTIQNTGSQPLQLFNMTSSCNCTVGQVIVGNVTSAEYGMHAPSDYITEIKPGGKGLVRVIYRPFVMPAFGTVEREVSVGTNDPQTPKLVFKVTAFVKE